RTVLCRSSEGRRQIESERGDVVGPLLVDRLALSDVLFPAAVAFHDLRWRQRSILTKRLRDAVPVGGERCRRQLHSLEALAVEARSSLDFRGRLRLVVVVLSNVPEDLL